MDTNTLVNNLKTMSVEEVAAWMVENMGHKSLKQCVRKITDVESEKKKTSKTRSLETKRKKTSSQRRRTG